MDAAMDRLRSKHIRTLEILQVPAGSAQGSNFVRLTRPLCRGWWTKIEY